MSPDLQARNALDSSFQLAGLRPDQKGTHGRVTYQVDITHPLEHVQLFARAVPRQQDQSTAYPHSYVAFWLCE